MRRLKELPGGPLEATVSETDRLEQSVEGEVRMPMGYAIDHGGTVSTLPPAMQIFLLTEGVTIQAALTLAANLGIADLLAEGPQTSDWLAQATSTHPPSLYRVCLLYTSDAADE